MRRSLTYGWQVEELLHQDSKGLTFAASSCGQDIELHRRQTGPNWTCGGHPHQSLKWCCQADAVCSQAADGYPRRPICTWSCFYHCLKLDLHHVMDDGGRGAQHTLSDYWLVQQVRSNKAHCLQQQR
eukprot:5648939-Amphidinium_carterae.1